MYNKTTQGHTMIELVKWQQPHTACWTLGDELLKEVALSASGNRRIKLSCEGMLLVALAVFEEHLL